ncbi:MAG: MIP family channel proteins [Pirellulaceae bacterium]|jgi:MIP family channel proteins
MTNQELPAPNHAREFGAEFLGTFVLMVFGVGVNASVFLGEGDAGDFFSVNAGWGIAVMLGVYVAGGISGAHINPAVTLAMAVSGRFPWNKVPRYVAAQFLGAIVASALIYLVYYEALDKVTATSPVLNQENRIYSIETSAIWVTYPRTIGTTQLSSIPTGLVDQIVGTFMLVLCLCALSDSKNMSPQSNMGPLAVGAVVFMIGMSLGFNAGYAINPARDLGPRLFLLVAGWGTQLFTTPDSIWWLVPVVGPCIGACLGATAYDQLITRFHPSDSSPDAVN